MLASINTVKLELELSTLYGAISIAILYGLGLLTEFAIGDPVTELSAARSYMKPGSLYEA